MTSLRMALSELRRITAGRLPKAALIAMALIPTIYAGLYLYANHDPYAALKNVPAALVVEDTGAVTPGTNGTTTNVGKEVAQQLLDQHDFDWHLVSAEDAQDGITHGKYDFGITIPPNFSSALTSSARLDPHQAQLVMTTNDANSYLSTTIANTVTEKVRAALAQKVGTQAADQFLTGLVSIRSSLVQAADGASQLHDGIVKAASGAAQLKSGSAQLSAGASQLSSGLATMRSQTSSLPSQTRRLADGAQQVAGGDAQIAAIGNRVGTVANTLVGAYQQKRSALVAKMTALGLTQTQQGQLLSLYDQMGSQINTANGKVQAARQQLDRLASGAAQVAAGNAQLAAAMPTLTSAIRQAATGSNQLATGSKKLSSGASELSAGMGKLSAGSAQLADGLTKGIQRIPDLNNQTRDRIAQTLGNPVAIKDDAQTTAGSYGAGLAPFFMALAAWIGGYVLFMLVRPLSSRAMAANQTPLRVAVAGWLTPALIGIGQMAVMVAVVVAAVHVHAENIAGTLFFLIAASATFIAIVHALNAWLGSAGQFLGLVFMVLQLVTAGGTFPWQTIPHPLYAIHYLAPMTYTVDGLRQLMYGGVSGLVGRDLLVLAAWFAVAIFFTSRAARKQRVWTLKKVKPELAL